MATNKEDEPTRTNIVQRFIQFPRAGKPKQERAGATEFATSKHVATLISPQLVIGLRIRTTKPIKPWATTRTI